jgi:hypothetical protein
MASGDLIPSDHDQPEPAATEIQFALVIARMIDSIKNSPADLRQAVYDLARYKLQEQFTHADAKDIRQTQQALETAIRGVEEFSRQPARIPAPAPPPEVVDPVIAAPAPRRPPTLQELNPRVRTPLHLDIAPEPAGRVLRSTHVPWPLLKRTAVMIAILVGTLLVIQQRERLLSLAHGLPKLEWQTATKEPSAPTQVSSTPTQVPSEPASPPLPPKPAPLRPTDYGVYAVSNDALTGLQLLPGRPPDIRVAVSAAFKMPNRTVLPNGHPKFIVFRRDVTSSISDRAEVRIIAKIAREFSADASGRKPSDDDETWIIRNVAFPFRASPVDDNPEMYELHSEDPALELTPGRYALVLRSQAYGFSVEGETVDPRQCIERIVATNGTFYSDCKKP